MRLESAIWLTANDKYFIYRCLKGSPAVAVEKGSRPRYNGRSTRESSLVCRWGDFILWRDSAPTSRIRFSRYGPVAEGGQDRRAGTPPDCGSTRTSAADTTIARTKSA